MEATQYWTEETQAGTVRSSNDFKSNCNTENITWVDLLPEMLDFTEDSVKGTETDPVDPDEKIIDNKILEAAPNDRFVVEKSVKIEPELMTIRIRKVDHEFFLNTKLEIFNPVPQLWRDSAAGRICAALNLGPNSQSVQAHKSQLEGPGRQKEKFFVDEETDCVRCKLTSRPDTRRSCSTVTSAASPPGRKQTSRR